MNWTDEVPKESGYYWYKSHPETDPQIVEVNLGFETVSATGTDVHMWLNDDPDLHPKVSGEFWPVMLTPP